MIFPLLEIRNVSYYNDVEAGMVSYYIACLPTGIAAHSNRTMPPLIFFPYWHEAVAESNQPNSFLR